jgi:hypothetical protein
MKRIIIFFLLTLLLVSTGKAQQQLSIGSLSVDKSAVAVVPVSLTNTVGVSALQFDVTFPATLDYQSIALGTRKADHTVSSQLVQAGKLRVVVYSATKALLSGSSGVVVNISLKAGTNPGSNALSLSNIVLSDAAGSSVTCTATAGNVTVNGPIAEISTSSLVYGRVSNGTTSAKSVTVYNRGNRPFNITAATPNDAHFTVSNTFPLTVAANSNVTLQVAFVNAAGDYSFTNELNVTTTDPALASFKVALSATAYSINTLTIGSVSGSRSAELRIPLTVKNDAQLTGVQFYIQLPDSAKLVDNSLIKGSIAPAAMQFTCTQTGNKLKIIGYSNTNALIPVSNGELCAFKVRMNNYAGTYTVSASEAILANTTGLNVLSGNTAGSITLTAPRLSVATSVDFGRLNVGPTYFEKSFTLSNTGNEALTISALNFSNSIFTIKNASLPLVLAAGQSKSMIVELTDVAEGQKAGILTVVSNDKNTETNVSLSAQLVADFEISVANVTAKAGGSAQFEFSVRNDLNVSAIQFDLTVSPALQLISPSVKKTSRISDWATSSYKLANGAYRVLAYSTNNSPIIGTSGAYLNMLMSLPIDATQGDYNLNLSNVSVSNTAGKNVVSKSINGVLTINGITTEIPEMQSDIAMKQLPNEILVHCSNNCFIQLFDMQGKVIYQKNTMTDYTIIPIERHFVGIIKIVSGNEMVVKKIRL